MVRSEVNFFRKGTMSIGHFHFGLKFHSTWAFARTPWKLLWPSQWASRMFEREELGWTGKWLWLSFRCELATRSLEGLDDLTTPLIARALFQRSSLGPLSIWRREWEWHLKIVKIVHLPQKLDIQMLEETQASPTLDISWDWCMQHKRFGRLFQQEKNRPWRCHIGRIPKGPNFHFLCLSFKIVLA